MTKEQIMAYCHNANRAYCILLGEFSQREWKDSPDWVKHSVRRGVQAIIDDPDRTPRESYVGWLRKKVENGWKYGKIKNAEKKEHPYIMAYDDLPIEQQVKNTLFTGNVKALLPLLEE